MTHFKNIPKAATNYEMLFNFLINLIRKSTHGLLILTNPDVSLENIKKCSQDELQALIVI